MNISSLYNTVKFNNTDGVYDLFEPIIIYLESRLTGEYTITSDDEMRIDLIFQNMYGIEPNLVYNYLENIDIILRMNNIDNPLNLKEGMVLRYPNIGTMDDFRYSNTLEVQNTDVIKKLATPNLPNKTTRIDTTRQDYIENNYSLPPVVLDTPREPVIIENGKFSIGGLQ